MNFNQTHFHATYGSEEFVFLINGLAEATHIPQSALARIESRSNTPKLDTLMKVIDALGCTIEVVPK